LLQSPAAAVTAGTNADTIFLVNTSEAPAEIAKRLDVGGAKVYTVDATKIALDCFGRPIPNMPMIGALLAVADLMSIDELQASMSARFERKFSPEVLAGNLQAVKRANEELVAA
jgi:pyruvate ferredoxin oxidoreductase gamma subunit